MPGVWSFLISVWGTSYAEGMSRGVENGKKSAVRCQGVCKSHTKCAEYFQPDPSGQDGVSGGGIGRILCVVREEVFAKFSKNPRLDQVCERNLFLS